MSCEAVEQAALAGVRRARLPRRGPRRFPSPRRRALLSGVNPLPGLNPESSDLVILAGLAGWTYEELIRGVFEAALDRHAASSSRHAT